MAIFMTDTHGYFGRLRPAAFREQGDLSKDDCRCRLFGHYRDNRVSKVKPILRIVQICQDPYRQAVKERAAQRRFSFTALLQKRQNEPVKRSFGSCHQ